MLQDGLLEHPVLKRSEVHSYATIIPWNPLAPNQPFQLLSCMFLGEFEF